MKKRVSQHFNLDRKAFAASGALDIRLDLDTRLFVDPFLLPHSDAPEFKTSRTKLLDYFGQIMRLLSLSRAPTDASWRQAGRMLSFPEQAGFNLGYSSVGTAGSGMGPRFTARLLDTAHEIVLKGIVDPVVFELVGLFEEGIGADRISDMTCRILLEDFLAYSDRVFTSCGLTGPKVKYRGREYTIPRNPHRRNHPVILVPQDVLRDLPIAYSSCDIDLVCAKNQELREKLNEFVGQRWGSLRNVSKRMLREFLLANPSVLQGLLDQYKRARPAKYNFANDPKGEVIWAAAADACVRDHPLTLRLPDAPTQRNVIDVARMICEQFTKLVEVHSWWRLLYKEDRKPKHEEAAQLLFFGCAEAYCNANNLDLSPESDAGRGPVDFKLSRGSIGKVVVEVKLSTNSHLLHGYESQLPEYAKAEGAYHAILLVVQVHANEARLEALYRRQRELTSTGRPGPEIIVIDGLPRRSASKMQAPVFSTP